MITEPAVTPITVSDEIVTFVFPAIHEPPATESERVIEAPAQMVVSPVIRPELTKG